MRASVAIEVAVTPAPQAEQNAATCNVVPIRLTLLARHVEYAAGWVRAGARMGLLDAAISEDDSAALVVWVRETAEPAYVIRPVRMNWVVTDQGSRRTLGAFRSFEQALHCIRPIPVTEFAGR